MSFPSGFIPVLPLRNALVFPGVTQALRVGRERSMRALEKAFEQGGWIITSMQKDPHKNFEGPDDLYSVGVLSKVESTRGGKDAGYQIMVRGYQRVKLLQFQDKGGFHSAVVESEEDHLDLDLQTQRALLAGMKEQAKEVLALIPANTEQVVDLLQSVEDINYLTYLTATHADFDLAEKQKILEMASLKDRTMHVLSLLQTLRENLKVQADIRQKLNTKFGATQRQHILREQMKAIKEELGEGDDLSLIDGYRKKIDEAGMTAEALEMANSQLKRLEEVNSMSPEYNVVRNHLDLMVALPWSKGAEQNEIDLENARKILDADHYGLDKIKKRIIQHLAVLKLKKNQKGSILVFVGPPGVGKTSLGQSIAKSLGKKYVRVSLGGVRDDAEIRGHRRTYVGALPGRILNGIKKAGENNPVFVLDEIDKLGKGFSGDPASALLEVLDPEQNNNFVDHYLETGFDLSKVMFIGTANSLEGIPGPLLDRMEIIEVSGYTIAEKFHIAKNHLIPKQMREHGIEDQQLVIHEDTLNTVITRYTREAGVRDLQRKIAAICRWASEKILAQGKAIIETSDLDDVFGNERYRGESVADHSVPGVVTGMAWTPVGGDILFIETALMPGKGALTITGQLGDVMKESAHIALSLLKTRLPFMAGPIDFSKFDMHVHVPAGATPKDGPSAGVTLLTSMASLLLRRGVDPRLAMTGEVTLRGQVMPVGGIKEKVLAAHRAGIKNIILPKWNEQDAKEIPEEVRKEISIHFVSHINEVLKLALGVELSMTESEFPSWFPPLLGAPANSDPQTN
ncbi:MAG: endopeptidase La [Bdellovibrionota bacterium]